MQPYTSIPRQKGTKSDPYRIIPIPPRSVVRFAGRGRISPRDKAEKGQVYRIGYYGEKDGLDCIWLVNDVGEYQETLDHDYLFQHYDIIVVSDEVDLYGRERPLIPPIRKAGKGHVFAR